MAKNWHNSQHAYAGGESEKVMGEAIKKFRWKRNDLVISAKVRRRVFCFPLVVLHYLVLLNEER